LENVIKVYIQQKKILNFGTVPLTSRGYSSSFHLWNRGFIRQFM